MHKAQRQFEALLCWSVPRERKEACAARRSAEDADNELMRAIIPVSLVGMGTGTCLRTQEALWALGAIAAGAA